MVYNNCILYLLISMLYMFYISAGVDDVEPVNVHVCTCDRPALFLTSWHVACRHKRLERAGRWWKMHW